jgi:1,4-alpha-glucan branching enzyme
MLDAAGLLPDNMKSYTASCIAAVLILLFSGCAPKHPGLVVENRAARFVLCAPSAHRVAVAGSFNQWDAAKNVLSGPDQNGFWTAAIILPEGRHEYLFIIDDKEWLPDPAAPAADDGMGGKNSVLVMEKPGD